MLAKLKKLQFKFLEWFVQKMYSEKELAEYDATPQKEKEEKIPDSLPNGTIVFQAGNLHALPPHIKEQIFSKMGFPAESRMEESTTFPTKQKKSFSEIDSQDMIILNNMGHWLSSSGQEGVTDEGMPIMRSTLDAASRKRANEIFVKMLNRIDKHIELKNNGTI